MSRTSNRRWINPALPFSPSLAPPLLAPGLISEYFGKSILQGA
jgi:hypothetical protein